MKNEITQKDTRVNPSLSIPDEMKPYIQTETAPSLPDAPETAFEQLYILDPDLTRKIWNTLRGKKASITPFDCRMLEQAAIDAFTLDIGLGERVAEGYAALLGEASEARLKRYAEEIRAAAARGPNLGRMMAKYWAPILRYGDEECLRRFPELLGVMLSKGEYTLKKPLDYLCSLLSARNPAEAAGFMGLLHDVFSQKISYNQSLHLARRIPQSADRLSRNRRSWQMSQIRRVIRTDAGLTDPFLKAVEKGLHLLTEAGLKRFVSLGLEKYEKNPRLGRNFLTLASKLGQEAWQSLLVTVPFKTVRHDLSRYLKARTGRGIAVRPLSALSRAALPADGPPPLACSDGVHLYLPDEISHFETRQENLHLYKTLARLESAYYEFGTFNFDLERAAAVRGLSAGEDGETAGRFSDLERFFRRFPHPNLAADLFTIFEQGRMRWLLSRHYPGIIRSALPVLEKEARRMSPLPQAASPLRFLFLSIVLGQKIEAGDADADTFYAETESMFSEALATDHRVETSAWMTWRVYDRVAEMIHSSGDPEEKTASFRFPFGRRVRPDLFYAAHAAFEETARRIRMRLADQEAKVYQSDIRNRLMENRGTLNEEDVRELVLSRRREEGGTEKAESKITDLSSIDLSDILKPVMPDSEVPESSPYPVFRYPEWDHGLGDFLEDHVRVQDRYAHEVPGNFYDRTLKKRSGAARGIRRAFERLKPEDVTILRNWPEGDEFDYRALIDYAVDRKAGIMPSDRLYIKRIKQQRDVAVLLLVDLSRSTSGRVFDSDATVLDVEKEAIVLFCEALEVVGDHFAVAGFSGTGRLSVDYFRIKDFEEPLDATVKARISGMSPQRSTRMGGAVRHASRQLEKIPAKVRILILLSDGFPNDTDYKREYAIADTRKAIAQARAKDIRARAVTVNIVGASQLDELYGSFHHNVISDVRELPDKLLRIYGTLTR